MPQETKMRLIEAVEIIAPEKKGDLYLKLLEVVEEYMTTKNTADDWLEAAKPTVRIHRAPNDCVACEA